MVTYYSKAWIAACVEHLNNSERHLKKARKLNTTATFQRLNLLPPGRVFFYAKDRRCNCG